MLIINKSTFTVKEDHCRCQVKNCFELGCSAFCIIFNYHCEKFVFMFLFSTLFFWQRGSVHSYIPSTLTSSIGQGKLSYDLRPSYWEQIGPAGLRTYTDILDDLVKPYLHSRWTILCTKILLMSIVYVVVQFYPWFKFYLPLFWGMLMYDNKTV